MLAALALRSWKPIAAGAAILLAIVIAAIAFERGMAAIERMETRAAATAKAASDAHWREQIAASNALVAEARADAAHAALEAAASLRSAEQRFELELSEERSRNASLPEIVGRGIGRPRVRVLNGGAVP